MVKYFLEALEASQKAAEAAVNTTTATPTPGQLDKARKAFRYQLANLAHYHFGGCVKLFSNADLNKVREVYISGPTPVQPKDWVNLLLTLEVECKACGTTGVYVTQHGTEEDCFRCEGRGWQGYAARRRNRHYDLIRLAEWEKANAGRRPPPDTK